MGIPVHVLTGDDPVLLSEASSALLRELLGDRSPDGVVDEFSGDEYQLSSAVMAAATVSMFGERIVVARNAGRFSGDDLAPLLAYLEEPNPDSTLVIVWERPVTAGVAKKPFAKKLGDAVKAAGGVVTATSAPTQAKQVSAWVHERLAASELKFAPATEARITSHLGEEVNRLGALVETLEASFAKGTRIDPDMVEPYLSTAGGVPPWDLTDALNSGDVSKAVTTARRMMLGGGRHPLQLMATLQNHYEAILKLDGTGVRTESQAADLLGMKPFPAKKILGASRRLGSDGVRQAIRLLAKADVDLRGYTAVPAEATLEVLVGRLAALARG